MTYLSYYTFNIIKGYSIGRATGTNKSNLSLKDDSSSEDTSTIVQSKSTFFHVFNSLERIY